MRVIQFLHCCISSSMFNNPGIMTGSSGLEYLELVPRGSDRIYCRSLVNPSWLCCQMLLFLENVSVTQTRKLILYFKLFEMSDRFERR